MLDLVGTKYNRLVVVKEVPRRKNKRHWLCECACGSKLIIMGESLRSGNTKSCGCLQREKVSRLNRIHGESDSITFKTWLNVKKRCYTPSSSNYKYYGGAGVTVCDRWLNSYINFKEDMGERPSVNHHLDKDLILPGNKVYAKEFCQWVLHKDNCRGRSNAIYLTIDNETKLLVEWSEQLGVKYTTMYARYKNGYYS